MNLARRAPAALSAIVLSLAVHSLAAQTSAASAPQPGAAATAQQAAALVTAFQDKLNLDNGDLSDTFTLVQKKDGEPDRVLRVRIYRRDAKDTFTLIFQYPASEKGKGYWRSKDDLYLYLPTTREFVYRNRKDDVGSTDVRTDLFGKTDLLSQYDATLDGVAKVATWETDVVRLDAKKLDVSYPIQKWYIRRGDGLPVKVENFSAGGVLLRTSYYIEYKEIAKGRYIFTKLLAVDALEKGQKTFLTNDEISTAKIPDYTFSKAFLEEQSR
ncbi:MAG: outer membrane lipoprotein-sorting protein [Treponema sp.]|nr:outer membrane lipoprotein-sorting protein [Treponema sp.]